MISRLKRRFTVLATVAAVLLMAVLVLIMNLVNYSSVAAECDTVLDVLSQPNAPFFDDMTPPGRPEGRMEDFIPRGMSPEVPYESRFFTVVIGEDGEAMSPDFSRIVSVDSELAAEYAERALSRGGERGFVGDFRYLKTGGGKVTRIMFLDCGRRLDAFKTFLWTSIGVGLFGCLVVFLFFLFASGRIVKPIAESYEKQKRFISDAGHEIKTPLTIIGANVDLLECDGEREELDEIRHQTKRLAELTNNLVLLSKMEETEHEPQMVDLPLSDIVCETTGSFRAPAAAGGIEIAENIEPDITANASPDTMPQLVSLLVDNAVKYSPEGGTVTVELSKGKRTAVLTVSNATADKVSGEDLPYVFDRFYRTDASRNSATGGHGIGLSVAKAITEAHGGTITAATESGYDFRVTVTVPLGR